MRKTAADHLLGSYRCVVGGYDAAREEEGDGGGDGDGDGDREGEEELGRQEARTGTEHGSPAHDWRELLLAVQRLYVEVGGVRRKVDGSRVLSILPFLPCPTRSFALLFSHLVHSPPLPFISFPLLAPPLGS